MTAATTTLTAERSSTAVGRVARSATEIAQPPLVLSVLLILASSWAIGGWCPSGRALSLHSSSVWCRLLS